jgi:fructose/tagatose bisphosphate aldolase
MRISRSGKRYLERMSKMDMTLELELGITGGEEDGVDNTGVSSPGCIHSRKKLPMPMKSW